MDGLVRTGVADLRLHGGRAPIWLVGRMINLARAIVDVFVEEFGADRLLMRLSDPLWFQALSCALGYDWDSSGTTTVTCGVLKTAISPTEHGLVVCGGKGRKSLETQHELEQNVPKFFDFSQDDVSHFKYVSRMAAKVDNAAIQDGYHLYHHAFLISEAGKWAVIQQGMNSQTGMVRRYHWLSTETKSSLVDEPHTGIVSVMNHGNTVLDMTSRLSERCRKTCTDLTNEGANKLAEAYSQIRVFNDGSTTLRQWTQEEVNMDRLDRITHYRLVPSKMDWKALSEAYNIHPNNYEQLLAVRGVGPATVRGLALISELLYGEEPSWKDPVKFSFAFGGKDGVPFPVERKAMDEATHILQDAINKAKISERDKIDSIRRLREFARQT